MVMVEKKNITRGHLIAGHRMPPAKSPNQKQASKKKNGQACPKFDAGSAAGDLAGDPTKTTTRRATGGRMHRYGEK